jgi:hypothetical protein
MNTSVFDAELEKLAVSTTRLLRRVRRAKNVHIGRSDDAWALGGGYASATGAQARAVGASASDVAHPGRIVVDPTVVGAVSPHGRPKSVAERGALTATSAAHELMERRVKPKAYGRDPNVQHGDMGVLMKEHNMASRLEGPGANYARKHLRSMRKATGEDKQLRDLITKTYGPRAAQFLDEGQKIPRAMRRDLQRRARRGVQATEAKQDPNAFSKVYDQLLDLSGDKQYARKALARPFQKRASGTPEHRLVASRTAKAIGASPQVTSVIQQGATRADRGIRHPFMPHTDPIHAFPGSQTKKDIGRTILEQQRRAVADISKSIAGQSTRDRNRAGVRRHRGLLGLGQTSHTLQDLAAHYEKPVEMGIAKKRHRSVTPKIGYGGGLVSGREHAVQGGVIDRIGRTKADAVAERRARGLGSSTHRKVRRALEKEYSYTPEQARAATDRFFQGRQRTGLASRGVARVTRDASYLRREASRLRKTVAAGGASITRAGRLALRRRL